MMSACRSSARSHEVERVHVAAEVVDLEARPPCSMVMAMSLPISWTSPLTVPTTMTPRFTVAAADSSSARLEHAHGALHGARREHQLGQEDVAGGELVADLAHAGAEPVHDGRHIGALLERRAGQFPGLRGVSVLYRQDELVKRTHQTDPPLLSLRPIGRKCVPIIRA